MNSVCVTFAPLTLTWLRVHKSMKRGLLILVLGLVVAALAPSQTVASGLSGGLFFLLLLLSGLWIQPAIVGEPLATIMYYSPSGAPVRALLYSVFNATPPLTAIVTMLVYAPIFTFIAIRYFRWE